MDIDIEKAKQEFIEYTNKYDFKLSKVKGKYFHSLRVMDCAGRIAESINLDKEEIELAKLIGLLHDIARFDQYTKHKTFNDSESFDHGDLGAEILKKDEYIRKYIEEDKYDNIILKAIKNHNKFKIEEGLSEKELLFSKIIRDADKLDIFYEGVEYFWITEEDISKVEKSKEITYETWNNFINGNLIEHKYRITPLDEIICFIALAFDLNFEYTLSEIRKQKYIEKLLDKFDFEDMEVEEKMDEVRERMNLFEISDN